MWQDYDDAHLRPAPSDRYFDPLALRQGTRVEMEHTQDRYTAKQIAKHHLVEDPSYYAKLHQIHLDGVGFGDARGDLISVLAIVMGRSQAEAWVKSLEAHIRDQVKQGAIAALPTIKTKAMPYVIGVAAVSGLGVLLGLVAIIRSRRK
jgi:hypothetical protein